MAAAVHPLEVRNHRKDRWLKVTWPDGVTVVLPHRLLREACRCAHDLTSVRAGENIRGMSGVMLDAVEALWRKLPASELR